jgi:hypothetical protein
LCRIWVIAAMWIAWLAPVAAQRQPVDLPAAGGHPGRRGAVAGGEVAAAGEPGHIGNIADDQPGDDRADAEQAGQGGAAGPDRSRQLLGALAALGVQAAQVGHELGGQVVAGGGNRPGRGDLVQDAGGQACGDLSGEAARDQPAARHASGRRLGCGTGPGHDAAWPRS